MLSKVHGRWRRDNSSWLLHHFQFCSLFQKATAPKFRVRLKKEKRKIKNDRKMLLAIDGSCCDELGNIQKIGLIAFHHLNDASNYLNQIWFREKHYFRNKCKSLCKPFGLIARWWKHSTARLYSQVHLDFGQLITVNL